MRLPGATGNMGVGVFVDVKLIFVAPEGLVAGPAETGRCTYLMFLLTRNPAGVDNRGCEGGDGEMDGWRGARELVVCRVILFYWWWF